MSIASDRSHYSLNRSVEGEPRRKLSKLETAIANKMAYEWKNIFRNLTLNQNTDDHYLVQMKEFEHICSKFKVSFSNEEVNKLVDLFCDEIIYDKQSV